MGLLNIFGNHSTYIGYHYIGIHKIFRRTNIFIKRYIFIFFYSMGRNLIIKFKYSLFLKYYNNKKIDFL